LKLPPKWYGNAFSPEKKQPYLKMTRKLA